jgi:hypothetical protein
MPSLSAPQACTSAAVAGTVLWLGATIISGRREAWDSSFYWTVAYPAAVLCAAALGYLAPVRPWRWALVLMGAQAISLAVAAGSFGLLPLGLILFGILALPAAGAASWAARLRLRQTQP